MPCNVDHILIIHGANSILEDFHLPDDLDKVLALSYAPFLRFLVLHKQIDSAFKRFERIEFMWHFVSQKGASHQI